jgi:hypothetical protein
MIHTPSIVCGIYIIGTYNVGSMLTSSHSWAHILALLMGTRTFLGRLSLYVHTQNDCNLPLEDRPLNGLCTKFTCKYMCDVFVVKFL